MSLAGTRIGFSPQMIRRVTGSLRMNGVRNGQMRLRKKKMRRLLLDQALLLEDWRKMLRRLQE
jgi:hypothetical protein